MQFQEKGEMVWKVDGEKEWKLRLPDDIKFNSVTFKQVKQDRFLPQNYINYRRAACTCIHRLYVGCQHCCCSSDDLGAK